MYASVDDVKAETAKQLIHTMFDSYRRDNIDSQTTIKIAEILNIQLNIVFDE